MNFNKYDIHKYFSDSRRATTRFIALRRANLGHWKNVTCNESNSRIGNYTAIRSMVHFTPEEVIEFFEAKKKEHLTNAWKKTNKMYIKNWDEVIEMAKYFKGKR